MKKNTKSPKSSKATKIAPPPEPLFVDGKLNEHAWVPLIKERHTALVKKYSRSSLYDVNLVVGVQSFTLTTGHEPDGCNRHEAEWYRDMLSQALFTLLSETVSEKNKHDVNAILEQMATLATTDNPTFTKILGAEYVVTEKLANTDRILVRSDYIGLDNNGNFLREYITSPIGLINSFIEPILGTKISVAFASSMNGREKILELASENPYRNIVISV